MDDAPAAKKSAESIAAREAALLDLARRYRDDPDLRARLDAGEVADCLADLDISLPPGVEVRFVANTRDTSMWSCPWIRTGSSPTRASPRCPGVRAERPRTP